jgi:hypothetical protein
MWRKYFSITGCKSFVMPGIGLFDRDNDSLDPEKLKRAYDKGCPFIAPTPEGVDKYYPNMKKIEPAETPKEVLGKKNKNKQV